MTFSARHHVRPADPVGADHHDLISDRPGFVEEANRKALDDMVEDGLISPDGEWISKEIPKPPGWDDPN